jgi:Zn-dependent metalloprotease/uncharacterized protein YjdB
MLMKKRISYPLLLLLFSMVTHGLYAQQKAKDPKGSAVVRNKKDNTPTSIKFAAGSKLSAENADEILKEYLGYDPSVVRMELVSTTTTKQNILVKRYEEYVKGIKVEFSSYSLMSKEGNAQFMTGNFYNVNRDISVKHKLSEEVALQAALRKTGAEKYMWQVPGMEKELKATSKDMQATYYPKGNLVWIEDRSNGEPDRRLHLAYSFNIYASKPLSRNMVYVDANTGKILFVNQLLKHTGTGTPATASTLYSGSVAIMTAHIGDSFVLNDSTRGGGVNTYNMNNTGGDVITEFTNSSTTWTSEASLDAHWGAEMVYDYWLSEQARNSFDNEGATINSYVHVLESYNNAFWNGSAMFYGDGTGIEEGGFSPLTALDVCAHEIGHAVCQYTANLVYAGESGAMNEGFSDIWGAVIENWANPHETDAVAKNIWAMGEEIGLFPLRRMDTPSLRGDPNTYNGTNWVNVAGCSPGDANDQCGVHTNSGVLNHWFYFLTEGGAGTNENGHSYSVSGVGISTAAAVAYNTELALSSTADYALCRTTSINIATMMYGECSAEVRAVRDAWYAVGVFSSEEGSAAGSITGSSAACIGTTLALTSSVSGGSWISQYPTLATVSSSGVVTPIATGVVSIYYFVNDSCGIVSTGITLTVNASPAGISALPDSAAICPSTSVILKMVSPGVLPIITQNFNSGLGSWSIDNTGNMSSHPNAPWQIHPDGWVDAIGEWHSPDASSFLETNSDAGGGDGITQSKLISPVFSLAGYTNCVLSFQHTYSQYPTDINVQVDISTDAGATWTFLQDYIGTSVGNIDGFVNSIVDLSAYDGMSNLMIRYHYHSDYGWYWAVDNIVIGRAAMVANAASWSPATALYTNAGLTTIYTGGVFDSVFAAPTTDITYTGAVTNAYGCSTSATAYVSINSTAPITGLSSVCAGSEITLSDVTPGGSWSTSNASVATVGSTGIVTGVSGGTAAISYIVTESCGSTYAVKIVTVISLPAAIGGTAVVCEGSTTTLTSSPGGGTWSSSGAEATVGSAGTVTGVSAGTVTVTYTAGTGCITKRVVTVNAVPTSITGSLGVCVSGTTSLSSTPTGGTWTVTYTSKATVGSTSGIVTGVASGTTPITYTAGGCRTISTVTVSATPATIGGSLIVCVGNTTNLTSATTGGTWSSSDGAVATVVSGTGVLTGVSTGTAIISYSNGTCERTAVVTVNASLGANTGSSTVCVGQSTDLNNATSGGTWSSSNTARATVNATSGLVAGVSAGTVNISYRIGAGCFSVTEVTVNTSLSSITGTASVCPGATTTLSHSDAGGAWSSSNTTRATVDASTGVVTGVTAGTVYITYTVGGCFTSRLLTVSAAPAAITGTASMCVGATTTLSSTSTGGTWTSSDGGVATVVSGTGVVTAIGAGTATISYQTSGGCVATRVVSVTAAPGAIGGTLSACVGTTTTLTSSPGGGSWSSSSTATATVGSATGVVAGVSAGTAIITYAISSSCIATAVLTVNPIPGTIGGALTVCATCMTTLSSSPGGGAWSSSNGAAATINASTGVVSGVGVGTTTISYVAGGCLRTTVVTVTPSTSPSTGTPIVCVGQTNSTLANPISGGVWSSSNVSIASINAATGVLTGVSAGNANITYATSGGSYTIIVATVNAAMSMNAGTFSICPLTSTTLTNATGGGTWSSSNGLIATVVAGTGAVSGVASGTANISYIVNVGCYRVSAVTIKSQPTITTSSSVSSVVIGGTRTLNASPGGGAWSSAAPAIATATGSGVGTITGVSLGVTTVTYTNSVFFGGCFRTRSMTVNPARPGVPVVSSADHSGVLTVFPNPTSGTLTIDAPEAGTFTVYALDGKEVVKFAVTASANRVSLPFNLATGIYMCRFSGADGSSAIVRLVYEQ